jgi:S1-C subfamily serine protease
MSLLLWYADPAGRPRARVLRGSISVGTAMGSGGILLHGASVAGVHAAIEANRAPPFVSAVAPEAAVFVNGLLVKSAALADGDVIRFGDSETRVSLSSRWAEKPVPRKRLTPEPHEMPSRATVRPAFLIAGLAAVFLLSLSRAPRRARLETGIRAGKETALAVPSVTSTRAARAVESLTPYVASTSSRSETPFAEARPVASLETDATDLIGQAMESVVSISGDVKVEGQRAKMIGSGFFISGTGLILTNAHVMAHEGTYVARAYDGRHLDVQAQERDLGADLGILAVVGQKGFRALKFGSTLAMKPGAKVFAIGSPLAEELSFTVTQGIVSSRLRHFDGHAFLQHDAAISPGNSGGPLLDALGRVVGINTWKIAGASTQGLSFAIPIEVAEELLRTWKVER